MFTRTSVDVDFLEPDVIQRRIADVTAGNQQSWRLRSIAWKNDINLRAAIAIPVLAPRSMAAQVIDVLRRRRDDAIQVEFIHQGKQPIAIVKHGEPSNLHLSVRSL